jgi:hypothetical protein
MSPPSNRAGFRPDAATTAHGPRLRDNQTRQAKQGLDCGTGRPGERSLSALYEMRITLCYGVITVIQTAT